MPDELIFPSNPFEDVKPSEFNKLNKKHVTEDFVSENLKRLGWKVYTPFHDTGIDRIIVKVVCPDGHTPINENLMNNKCPVCNKDGIEITRFVQVKTRQLKENVFGFTLKSKDIRIDPRHVYLLYSDNTSADKQDFLFVPVTDYLKFFLDHNMNPFAPTSFRKGNNKLNSLRYNPSKNRWSWGNHDWEMFRNADGIKRVQNPIVDLNLVDEIRKTRIIADKLQIKFERGRSYSSSVGTKINQQLEKKMSLYVSTKEIINLRKNVDTYLKEKCDDETYLSMKKYFEFIKTQDTIGDDENED